MNTGIKNAIEYEVWKMKENFSITNITADKIDLLILQRSKARLYNENPLTYGELITEDESGNKKTYFYVLSSLSLEMYERYGIEQEHSSLELSRGKVVEDRREFQIAFFSESSEFLRTIQETKEILVRDSFQLLFVYITIVSLVCLVLFLFWMRMSARKMTK